MRESVEQFSAVPIREKWTVSAVNAAIRGHGQGNFTASAWLCESMTTDDAVDAVLQVLAKGISGLPKRVVESSEGPKIQIDAVPPEDRAAFANQLVSIGQALVSFQQSAAPVDIPKLLERLNVAPERGETGPFGEDATIGLRQKLSEFCPRSAVFEGIWWAALLGFAVFRTSPEWELWHPSFVRWDQVKRVYIAQTTTGEEVVTPGENGWFLYAPNGGRSWVSGAVRSIGTPWIARQYALRDWARHSELYGLGIRKVKTPIAGDSAVKKRFASSVRALGQETTVVLEGPEYDLDVLFPPATNAAQGFEMLISKCEARFAIRILGQNLTTEASGGSYAAASVHATVKADIVSFYAETWSEAVNKQIVQPWLDENFLKVSEQELPGES